MTDPDTAQIRKTLELVRVWLESQPNEPAWRAFNQMLAAMQRLYPDLKTTIEPRILV